MKSDTMKTLPALKQPDGKVMCETEDIMKHLATMGGSKLVVSLPSNMRFEPATTQERRILSPKRH